MVRLPYQRPFLLGMSSPQYEDHPRLLRGNQLDNMIGESLPPPPLMRIGLVRPDRENRVEHEHALSGPWLQIAIIRDRAPKVFMKIPKDVSQRERYGLNVRLHGETETMRMARGWIWILADQEHLDLVIRCDGQCVKDIPGSRQNRLLGGSFFF